MGTVTESVIRAIFIRKFRAAVCSFSTTISVAVSGVTTSGDGYRLLQASLSIILSF